MRESAASQVFDGARRDPEKLGDLGFVEEPACESRSEWGICC